MAVLKAPNIDTTGASGAPVASTVIVAFADIALAGLPVTTQVTASQPWRDPETGTGGTSGYPIFG